MQRVRRTRSLQQYEETDQEIKQTDDLEVFLMTKKLLGWRGDDSSIDFLFIADDGVCGPGPGSQFVEELCNVALVSNGLTIDRLQNIAAMNARLFGRSLRRHETSLHAGPLLYPGSPVVRRQIPPLLLSVESP